MFQVQGYLQRLPLAYDICDRKFESHRGRNLGRLRTRINIRGQFYLTLSTRVEWLKQGRFGHARFQGHILAEQTWFWQLVSFRSYNSDELNEHKGHKKV